MYTALQLSAYIVNKCIDDGIPVSNLQLQKILYYIQKKFISNHEKAFNEDFEAWQFGPVIPEVYYHYCGYGAMPISIRSENSTIEPKDFAAINEIIEEKRQLDPWVMVRDTHKLGSAWYKTYNSGLGNHTVIKKSLIESDG